MAKEYNFDTVSGVENVSGKKGKKIAGITAGALAVAAVGGGAAAYSFSDYVKNQVNLRVMKPQSYYAWVNEENSKTTAEKAADRYKQYVENLKSGQTVKGDLTFELSKECKDMLSEEMAYGDDEYVDIIKNIDSLNFNMNSSSKKGVMDAAFSFGINGNTIVSADYALDPENMDYFFRIPELTEKWLAIDADSFTEEMTDEQSRKISNAYKEFIKDPESFLSPDEFQDVVERYMGIWNKSIEEVTEEKNESVDICDITVEYTALTTVLDGAKQKEIAENVINELKNDEVIKKIVVDKIGLYTEEEYAENLDEELENISEDAETLTVVTYVDPKGEIRGITANEGESFGVKLLAGKDDDQVRGEFEVNDDGDITSIKVKATEDNDKYTGNVEIFSEDTTTTVDFTDFEIVNEETCFFNADLTVNAEDEEPFSVKCSSDGNSQEVTADIEVDGVNYGKLKLDLSVDKSASPETPSKDDAFVFDPENSEIKDYVSKDELSSFINDVMTKIGFSKETADSSASSFAALLYGDYSAMFGDYDPTDSYKDFDDSDLEDFEFDSSAFEGADFDFSDLDMDSEDYDYFKF